MDLCARLKTARQLARNKKVIVKGTLFKYRNGLVFPNKAVEGFESPMTFDTFTHLYLEKVG